MSVGTCFHFLVDWSLQEFSWILIIFFLARRGGLYLCLANTSVLGQHLQQFHLPQHTLNMLSVNLKFIFQDYDCLRIKTDDSYLSEELATYFYSRIENKIFINDVYTELKYCEGFTVISKTTKDLKNILEKLPRLYEYRYLCIVHSEDISGEQWFNLTFKGREYFKDSNGIVIILSKETVIFQRRVPSDDFQRIYYIDDNWGKRDSDIVDFKGKEIKVAAFNCTFFSYIGKDENGKLKWEDGVDMILMDELSKRLNLTYTVHTPPDDFRWGTYVNESHFNGGILKMAHLGYVDIATCGTWALHSIAAAGLQMTDPISRCCLRLIVPRPKPVETHLKELLSPFEMNLWICVFLFVLLAAPLLCLFSNLSSSWNSKHNAYLDIVRCQLELVSIFLSTGVSKNFHGSVNQLVTWFVVLSLLLSACFSSGLISTLTLPRYTDKMEDYQQLFKEGYYWVSSYFIDVPNFINTQDKWALSWAEKGLVYKNIEELMENYHRNPRMVMFGEQVEDGVAFHDQLPNEFMNNFEASSQCLNVYSVVLVLRKGTPLYKPITQLLNRFQNGGLITKAINDVIDKFVSSNPYIRKVLRFERSKHYHQSNLTMNNLLGVFHLWLIGIVISIIGFVIELVYFYNKKKVHFKL